MPSSRSSTGGAKIYCETRLLSKGMIMIQVCICIILEEHELLHVNPSQGENSTCVCSTGKSAAFFLFFFNAKQWTHK